MFCEKDVLKNFAKFTGKQLCRSRFSNKVAYVLNGFRTSAAGSVGEIGSNVEETA